MDLSYRVHVGVLQWDNVVLVLKEDATISFSRTLSFRDQPITNQSSLTNQIHRCNFILQVSSQSLKPSAKVEIICYITYKNQNIHRLDLCLFLPLFSPVNRIAKYLHVQLQILLSTRFLKICSKLIIHFLTHLKLKSTSINPQLLCQRSNFTRLTEVISQSSYSYPKASILKPLSFYTLLIY